MYFLDVNNHAVDVECLSQTITAFNENRKFFIVVYVPEKDVIDTFAVSYHTFFKIRKYIPEGVIECSWDNK